MTISEVTQRLNALADKMEKSAQEAGVEQQEVRRWLRHVKVK
ncbi:hypothetical protein LCGC14_1099290 [marine sediment metagenome]|uniref:Uncharacterized protein n=1 Tax=marine sediment metagenome TaxID=412755 RepID=A0A0F9PT61_9ZZZZ